MHPWLEGNKYRSQLATVLSKTSTKVTYVDVHCLLILRGYTPMEKTPINPILSTVQFYPQGYKYNCRLFANPTAAYFQCLGPWQDLNLGGKISSTALHNTCCKAHHFLGVSSTNSIYSAYLGRPPQDFSLTHAPILSSLPSETRFWRFFAVSANPAHNITSVVNL
jgi:hypothetical protein